MSMDLDNIYQNNINKNPIYNAGISNPMGIPVSRERDPKLQKLENDVVNQMSDLLQNEIKQDDYLPETKSVDTNFVSFEDALKQLRELGEL